MVNSKNFLYQRKWLIIRSLLLKALKLFFCFIVSGLCLFLIFRKVDVSEVTCILLRISYTWLFIATVIGILKMWMTAFRWRYLALPCKQLLLTNSFYFYAIGTMINMTLPFRAGDLVRTHMIADALKLPNTKVLATIASEHLLDFITLCSLLVVCLLLYSYKWPAEVMPTMIVFFIVVISFFSGACLLKKNATIKLLQNYIIDILPKRLLFLSNMMANFYSGFFQLGGFFNILKILNITAWIWIAQGFWISALLYSLGILGNYHLGFEAISVLMVMMGVAVMIPASPGYIGTFHLMIVLGLTQMGVPKTISLSCAILIHAHAVAVAIFTGLYCLWKVNIKPSYNFNLTNKSNGVQKEVL